MEKCKGKYLFMVLAENLINSLQEIVKTLYKRLYIRVMRFRLRMIDEPANILGRSDRVVIKSWTCWGRDDRLLLLLLHFYIF